MSVRIDCLTKAYRQGDKSIEVLKNLDLELPAGESISIVGESGSGKSTLLSLLAGLDRPDAGRVFIENCELSALSDADTTAYRGRHIGVVFQQFHLMPHLTALENVALPMIIAGSKDWRTVAAALLATVGLTERMNHFPSQLSGGECQRVAIARALVNKPDLLLADEPTGNLDIKTAESVMQIFFDIVSLKQVTLILVTHNEKLAARCGRRAELKSGRLWL